MLLVSINHWRLTLIILIKRSCYYFCLVKYEHPLVWFSVLLLLHGPPLFVDKTNFDLKLYTHANFYRFEESFSYCSVKRISVLLCFSLVNQRHTFSITVYKSNIENIVRAVHNCNRLFFIITFKVLLSLSAVLEMRLQFG